MCEGGRSAYLQGRNKGGKLTTFLRNRRFMLVDPKHKVEVEAVPEDWAMVTRENQIAADCCLPAKLLAIKAQAAFIRTKSAVSGILKGNAALLTKASPQGPAARAPVKPRRKAVSWNSAVSQ